MTLAYRLQLLAFAQTVDPGRQTGMTAAMTASQQLRTRTATCHAAVDDAFGAYDLSSRTAYADLLCAHARALMPAEAAVDRWPALPDWRKRAGELAADVAALGLEQPDPLPFTLADEAAAWGALYVLEGSRLGNTVLQRQVGPDLPTGYMSARHLQGEWRVFLAMVDAAGERYGPGWIDRAVAGAEATFALFLAAAHAPA